MGAVVSTIAAVATPPGRGGVGIIRVSGPQAADISQQLLGLLPTPRAAHFGVFHNGDGEQLDEGIALFFSAPNSFTGEDVLELQGHGGPVVLHQILQAVCDAGAKLARPGEFSERAFLNGKMDLVQAESIADLIDASSVQAARSALRSLQGNFSEKIDTLLVELIRLRVFIESALDFSDEEIDFLADGSVLSNLCTLEDQIQQVLQSAHQGVLLQEGLSLVILGKPNAGKSSLLNCLAEKESAIVTEIAGTTRDVLKESIHIQGMPIHIVDTAGLRQTEDIIEQEGVRRAWQEAKLADLIVILVDRSKDTAKELQQQVEQVKQEVSSAVPLLVVYNKIDLTNETPDLDASESPTTLLLSAKTGAGIEQLKSYLVDMVGLQQTNEGNFSARARHIAALEQALQYIQRGRKHFTSDAAAELLAEELRLAQQYLSEITGAFTSDDLLGSIFSTFCIGK